LFDGAGLRFSAGGSLGGRDYDVVLADGTGTTLGDEARHGHVGLRLEGHGPAGRYGIDLWGQHRRFLVPPGEVMGSDVLFVDGESTARLGLWGEAHPAGWRVLARGYVQLLTRDSRSFTDATMSDLQQTEQLSANRTGAIVAGNRGLGAGLELVVVGAVDSESADVVGMDGQPKGGRGTIGELGAGLKWRRGPLRLDGAAGVALPDGATPWPEAKLRVTWTPVAAFSLDVIGARKGRVPTLRERTQLNIGNDALQPETATWAEAGVTVKPVGRVSLRAAAWLREIEQLIKFDAAAGMLVNIGQVSMHGLDLDLTFTPLTGLQTGASWRYIDASSDTVGDEPLDFLPAHKLEGFVSYRHKAKFGGGLRARWIDQRLDQGTTLPAYLTADATGFVKIPGGFRATLRVDNLAGAQHELRANGYRAPGRVVMLGVEGVWN
jgi:hypothetical protein